MCGENITEHYKYADIACPCCDRLKIFPGLYKHMNLLERMVSELGFPITVVSAYHCAKHNFTMQGVPRSWHLLFATDIAPEDGDPEKLEAMYNLAIELGFGEVKRYHYFIHIDMRPKRMPTIVTDFEECDNCAFGVADDEDNTVILCGYCGGEENCYFVETEED